MYWREYRTEFHIGLAYGISESTVCRTIKKIENTLIKSDQFHLPSRKALQSSGMELEIILVDATEQPVERPQKNSGISTAAKRNVIPRKRRYLRIWRQRKFFPLTSAQAGSMIFSSSKKVGSNCRRTFSCSRMPVIRAWLKSIPIAWHQKNTTASVRKRTKGRQQGVISKTHRDWTYFL